MSVRQHTAPARLTQDVVHYIAREAVRRYGPIEPRLPEKLQRNIRRNFGKAVPREDILRLAAHYKDIYARAREILPRFLRPQAGQYPDGADVRGGAFLAALSRSYPKEPAKVLWIVSWYAVHYEYLR